MTTYAFLSIISVWCSLFKFLKSSSFKPQGSPEIKLQTECTAYSCINSTWWFVTDAAQKYSMSQIQPFVMMQDFANWIVSHFVIHWHFVMHEQNKFFTHVIMVKILCASCRNAVSTYMFTTRTVLSYPRFLCDNCYAPMLSCHKETYVAIEKPLESKQKQERKAKTTQLQVQVG